MPETEFSVNHFNTNSSMTDSLCSLIDDQISSCFEPFFDHSVDLLTLPESIHQAIRMTQWENTEVFFSSLVSLSLGLSSSLT
jgi:hypothetical protein